MNILAIELSSARGSLALLENGGVLAEESWDEQRFAGQHVFAILPEMAKRAGWSLADLDVLAVGRGPGTYSGLRIAMAAARGLALPGGKDVHAVSSGAALAYEIGRTAPAESVAVVGDARRERAWFGIFRVSEEEAALDGGWSLAALGELESRLPAAALRVSPDWSRLGPGIRSAAATGRWIEEDRHPRARFIGLLAAARIARGIPSEPLTPIYVHPPVFVEPRFDE